MKTCTSIFLLFTTLIGLSQDMENPQKKELKLMILSSLEVREWQDAMIAFQKVNSKLCELKYEQRLNQNLFNICGKHSIDLATENFVLLLFRTMRITNELKEIAETKELVMRKNHPEIATHFKGDELFHKLYAPILKAREGLR